MILQYYFLDLMLNFFPSVLRCFFKHKYQVQEEEKAGHRHLCINYKNSSFNYGPIFICDEEE